MTFQLTVIQSGSTYFKQSPLDSSQLPASQKYLATQGSTFAVLTYQEAENNHYLVTFSTNIGPRALNTWYVYRPHVTIQSEEACLAQYKVKSGDTLSDIALKFYNNGTEAFWRRIYNANRDKIGSNPNNLYPGLELCIPTYA
jgi:nucleoid-associated protein YgaU